MEATEQKILNELLEEINSNRLVLPTLPEVALKVREAVEDENATASSVAKIIGTDAALSARLLQVANSPLYRARNPIENIQAAIARLGSVQVRNLVTSLVMQQMFQATNDVLDTRLRKIWEHGVEIAAISHVLASQVPNLQVDQAMLAGLIHDIGALPILVYAEECDELLDDEDLLDRMVSELHPMLGQKILSSWDFPDSLVAVAAEHENILRDPGADAAPDYVDIVIVANLQSYIGSEHPHTQIDWSTVPAFNRLGIESDVNIVDIGDNKEEIEGVQQMFIA